MERSPATREMAVSGVKVPGPYMVVAATSFGVFLTALDSSIVNVSLNTMAASFGVDIDEIEWVILAYLLILTSGMPLMGKLGDRVSKTRIFQLGMLVFVLGSLFCALSRTLVELVAFRSLEAVGASMMGANGLALVTYFTTPQNRGRAMGLSQVVLAAALGFGPVVGGVLTEFFGWNSIFLINIPIGAVGFVVVARIVPQTQRVTEVKFDGLGGTLFLSFLFMLIYSITVSVRGIPGESTVLAPPIEYVPFMVLAIGFAAAFVVRERRFVSPIIPLAVLGDRRIAASILSSALSYMALIPVSFLLPFFLQRVMDMNPAQTGLFLTIHPMTISAMGPIAGLLSEHVSARFQTVMGVSIQLLGLLVISLSMPNLLVMALGVVTMGSGLSMFTVANTNFIMTSAPKQYMGVVSALTNISRTSGFSVGTALAAAALDANLLALGYTVGNDAVYTLAVQYSVAAFCILLLFAALASLPRGLSPSEELRGRPVAPKDWLGPEAS